MCGIYGFNWHDQALASELAHLLLHRGPDQGDWVELPSGTVGARRLSIIDRSGGSQPMGSLDSDMVIVYNGEVYNYRDLRAELEILGHEFVTQSDTEVVLHAYEAWGTRALPKLNGMFAFAIAIPSRGQWFLARDPFGIKPLYYTRSKDRFAFSSEIRPLMRLPWVRKLARPEFLEAFLSQGHIAENRPLTFFVDIMKIPPGHFAKVEGAEVSVEKYSLQPPTATSQGPNEAAGRNRRAEFAALAARVRDLLITATRLRLQSEVPLGTCLSGGLDSSSVVCIINNLLKDSKAQADSVGERQHVFSAVYENFARDERRWIQAVTNATAVEGRQVRPISAGLMREIDQLVRTQEEPFHSPSVYAQWCVMRLAKESVTVVLDGQGGDEVFGGYETYVASLLVDSIRSLKFAEAAVIAWNGRTALLNLVRELRSASKAARLATQLLGLPTARGNSSRLIAQSTGSRLESDMEWELPLILRYADKNSMAFSIELRVPFLDTELVSFATEIPPQVRLHNGIAKALVRQAMIGIVPPQVLHRRDKVGYDVPDTIWLKESVDELSSRFSGPPWSEYAFLGGKKLAEVFRRKSRGRISEGEARFFWRLFIAGVWLQVFDLRVPSLAEMQAAHLEKGGSVHL